MSEHPTVKFIAKLYLLINIIFIIKIFNGIQILQKHF